MLLILCRDSRQRSELEVDLFVDNGNRVNMQFIILVHLRLEFGFILQLNYTLYVSPMKPNLVLCQDLLIVGSLLISLKDCVLYVRLLIVL